MCTCIYECVFLRIQFYWIFITLSHANLLEVLFSSFMVQACEQLQHLKEILNPLIELSATLDSTARNPADIFRAASAKNQPINGI